MDNYSESKIVNLQSLIEISKGDKAFVEKVIDLFLSQVPNDLSTLNKSIAEKNYKSIHAVAHNLKSSTIIIGLSPVARKILEHMEDMAIQSKGIENMQADLDTFSKYFGKAKNYLEAFPY